MRAPTFDRSPIVSHGAHDDGTATRESPYPATVSVIMLQLPPVQPGGNREQRRHMLQRSRERCLQRRQLSPRRQPCVPASASAAADSTRALLLATAVAAATVARVCAHGTLNLPESRNGAQARLRNTKGYSSTCLAMGLADVRAGTLIYTRPRVASSPAIQYKVVLEYLSRYGAR